jgi:hypothetical protein
MEVIMNVEELIVGQYYVYSQKLSIYDEEGLLTSWTDVKKLKYLGDLKKDHPEMQISHCAHYLFAGPENIESCGIVVNTFVLPKFDITECVSKLGDHHE